MATTKKIKVVDWRKELWKATGKYVMAQDKLFKDFEKEVRESPLPMHLKRRPNGKVAFINRRGKHTMTFDSYAEAYKKMYLSGMIK